MEANKEWHWFKGGILVSLLSVATYFLFAMLADRNYPFGITAGFGFIAGKFGTLFEGLAENPVIKRFSEKPDAFVEFFLVIGLIIGGYTSSKVNGYFKLEMTPSEWEKHQGKSLVKRIVFVIIGSVLLGYGAGLAGGCTTGNILQGWAHLSLGSVVAGASFFITGIIAARLLFPKAGGVK